MTDELLLEVHELVAGFGPTTVLHGVSFGVRRGEVAGVFGLNGAGKSVTLKVLAGVVPARQGSIRFAGEEIAGLDPEARVELGMGHVSQGRQVFRALSVEENLRLGAYTLRKRDRSRYPSVLAGVYDRFPVLAQRRNQLAGTLSGGQQASLAVGRALMAEPTLILIDEPSAGLAPIMIQELFVTLRNVALSGVTMVLVEQNVAFGLKVVDTANVLQQGRIVHTGMVGELDSESLARYLGIGRLLSSGVGRSVAARSVAPDHAARTRQRRPRPLQAVRVPPGPRGREQRGAS